MPAVSSPFFGINYGWALGEAAWGDPMNVNLQVMSFLDKGAVDDFVGVLPGSPADGDSVVYTVDNQLYFRIGGSWLFVTPQEGMEINKLSDGTKWQWNGSAWVEVTFVKKADLANTSDLTKGATLVGFKQNDSNAIATTVRKKLEVSVNAVVDYGADNTGATNATTALKNFFDYCIASGKNGHIPAGTYLVTAGVLVFDTPFIDADWPEITTDGHDAVTFKRATSADSPMIALTNGTATSAVGRYWRGGSLGGITFDQNGQTKAANQHGLSLRGVWATKFGWMRGNSMGGSCVHIPLALFGGTNPDPYAVSFCQFEAIEANACDRYGLENQNFLGLNSCRVVNLRVIQCLLGGWFGLGTSNAADFVSMGSNKGWSFDDGTNAAATGGAPLRITVEYAELDDQQNGIRLNRTRQAEFKFIRFVHRYNNTVLNTDNKYWPLKAIELCGGVSASTTEVNVNVVHRIEAGGTKPDVGIFFDASNSPNAQNIYLDQRILDNAGFGFADADLFTGISNTSVIHLLVGGRSILDTRIKTAALVRSSTAETVPNGGFPSLAVKINFPTEVSDRGGYYDSANSWFVVPYSGLYYVHGKICLTVAVGTRVRLGFGVDVSGVFTNLLSKIEYQVNAGAQHYDISGLLLLTAGQRLFLNADQNTGGAVALSAPFAAAADLQWGVTAVDSF